MNGPYPLIRINNAGFPDAGDIISRIRRLEIFATIIKPRLSQEIKFNRCDVSLKFNDRAFLRNATRRRRKVDILKSEIRNIVKIILIKTSVNIKIYRYLSFIAINFDNRVSCHRYANESTILFAAWILQRKRGQSWYFYRTIMDDNSRKLKEGCKETGANSSVFISNSRI